MTWKSLRHQNVLPLLGGMMCKNRLAMASEWMENGDVNKFIKAHKDVNRFELVGFQYSVLAADLAHLRRCLILAAQRRCSGIGIYAQQGDGTWRSKGGKISNINFALRIP